MILAIRRGRCVGISLGRLPAPQLDAAHQRQLSDATRARVFACGHKLLRAGVHEPPHVRLCDGAPPSAQPENGAVAVKTFTLVDAEAGIEATVTNAETVNALKSGAKAMQAAPTSV